MTKLFRIVLALMCFYTASQAQTKNTNEFGVQIGLNTANVYTDALTDTKYRVGFNAGVSVDHYFSESWSVKGKLLYDQKGWKGVATFTNGVLYDTEYHLDYLSIPLLANWHFGHTKNWYLNFGPYTSILLRAEETATGEDYKSVFKGAELGLDLGIGLKIPVSNKVKAFVELNGQGSFNGIVSNTRLSPVRNTVSALNVGVNF